MHFSGRILTGDSEALKGGPPVKAMLIQNTNPVTVAPEQALEFLLRSIRHPEERAAKPRASKDDSSH